MTVFRHAAADPKAPRPADVSLESCAWGVFGAGHKPLGTVQVHGVLFSAWAYDADSTPLLQDLCRTRDEAVEVVVATSLLVEPQKAVA